MRIEASIIGRKVVEALACYECDRLPCGFDEDGCCTTCGCDITGNVVKLVRADPTASAVVRAAVKWNARRRDFGEAGESLASDLENAVDRHLRKAGKK